MRHDEMACQLKAFLDCELNHELETEVREHIAVCSDCRTELEHLTDLCWRIAQLPEPESPADLRGRIVERVQRPTRRALNLRWSLAGIGIVAGAAVCLIALRVQRLDTTPHYTPGSHQPLVAQPGVPRPPANPSGPVVWHEAVLEIRVSNLASAWKSTRSLADNMAGRVYAYERSAADVRAGRQTGVLAIPLPRLRTALAELGNLGRVTYHRAADRDKTREVAELNGLIGRWRVYEEGCVRAMADMKTVRQVLEMDREVANAREQIARLQRQMNTLIYYGGSGMITIYLVGPSGDNAPMSCVTPPPNSVA